MIIETRTPRGNASGSELINPLPGKNDSSEHKQTALHLQVVHLRRRFILSEALAIATAGLAFPKQGRFA